MVGRWGWKNQKQAGERGRQQAVNRGKAWSYANVIKATGGEPPYQVRNPGYGRTVVRRSNQRWVGWGTQVGKWVLAGENSNHKCQETARVKVQGMGIVTEPGPHRQGEPLGQQRR